LNEVQIFDQPIALGLFAVEKRQDLIIRGAIQLAAARKLSRLALSFTRNCDAG
jgi:hypothetical protein